MEPSEDCWFEDDDILLWHCLQGPEHTFSTPQPKAKPVTPNSQDGVGPNMVYSTVLSPPAPPVEACLFSEYHQHPGLSNKATLPPKSFARMSSTEECHQLLSQVDEPTSINLASTSHNLDTFCIPGTPKMPDPETGFPQNTDNEVPLSKVRLLVRETKCILDQESWTAEEHLNLFGVLLDEIGDSSKQSAEDVVEGNRNVWLDVQKRPTPTLLAEEPKTQRSKRKRKRTPEEIAIHKRENLLMKAAKHEVLEGCTAQLCSKNCKQNFSEDDRKQIKDQFWQMDNSMRQFFIKQMVTAHECRERVVRRETPKQRKSFTRTYRFRDNDGNYKVVCQRFFLNTLGLKWNNDKIIRKAFEGFDLSQTSRPTFVSDFVKDPRGGRVPKHKIHRSIIKADVEKYQPAVPHYRCVHAPNRRYLPSDLTLREMYDRFTATSMMKITYQTYYRVFKSMNISFAKLGNEECEFCTEFQSHKKKCNCEQLCEYFEEYIAHRNRYRLSRELYNSDSQASWNNGHLLYSAELQKVVMLPMMDHFKRSIFTSRLCCFNATFSALGSRPKQTNNDIAILWHEGVAGRRDEDIASAFHKFLQVHRNTSRITLWLDNCSAENKNWTLFTMLSTLINHEPTMSNLDKITLNYFEHGHSFMSADSTHARIEGIFRKRRKTIFDFQDLSDCISLAHCDVHQLHHTDFRKWATGVSQYQLNGMDDRSFLREIVSVEFRRGKESLYYKTSHSQNEGVELSFLKSNFQPENLAEQNTKPRGVEEKKKNEIIKHLLPLMPENRRQFWLDLRVDNKSRDIIVHDK